MKFHSRVELITNSSTSIYSTATKKTVEEIKNFVDLALQLAESAKTSDDIFDIMLVPSSDAIETALDEGFEDLDENDEPEFFQHLTPDERVVCQKYYDASWKDRKEFLPEVEVIMGKLLTEGKFTFSSDWGERNNTQSVRIQDKNGNTIPEKITGSLDQWASYDG